MEVTDAYFDTQEEAFREVHRRKASLDDEHMIVQLEKTGYGNWRVYSVLADVMMDAIADGPSPLPAVGGFHHRKARWAR